MKQVLCCLLFCAAFTGAPLVGSPSHAQEAAVAVPNEKNGATTLRFQGRIVRPDDKPVAARAFWGTGWFPEDAAWTEIPVGPDGAFAFDAPATQTAPNVVAIAPGLAIGGIIAKVGGENALRLERPRSVGGTLRDDKGQPVGGATLAVRFFYIPGRSDGVTGPSGVPTALREQFRARSGPDGKWQITGLPQSAYVQVALNDPKFVRADTQIGPDGETSGSTRQTLRAVRAGSLSGRIVDGVGAPVANRLIYVQQPVTARGRFRSTSVRSEADGTFRFDSLPTGSYSVLVPGTTAPREKAAQQSPVVARAVENVAVVAGETRTIGDIVLAAGATLEGVVVHKTTGKPFARAVVSAWGAANPRSETRFPLATTDAEGRFRIAVAPGPVALFAYQTTWDYPGEHTETSDEVRFDLQAGESREATLRLAPVVTPVTGIVVDETGAPIEGVSVTIGRSAGAGFIGKSGANGVFKIETAPLGDVKLAMSSGTFDLLSPKKATLPLPEGQELRVVVRRVKVATLAGRVVTPAGVPVPEAAISYRVTVKTPEGGDGWSFVKATTDAQGRFSLFAARPDSQPTLEKITKEGFRRLSGGEVVLRDGVSHLADIVMEPLTRAVSGIVRDAAGAPVAGASVRSSADNFQAETLSDAEGRFTLGTQPENAVSLLAAHGRRYARGEEKDGVLTLQESPPFVVDVSRAAELFEEAIDAGIDRTTLAENARLLAPFDAETAFALLQQAQTAPDDRGTSAQTPDELRATLIRTIARSVARVPHNEPLPEALAASLAWSQAQLAIMKESGSVTRSASLLGFALVERDRERAVSLLKFAQPRSKDAPGRASAFLAALAARLDAPSADDLLLQALRAADGEGDRAFAAAFRVLFKPGTVDSELTLSTILPGEAVSTWDSVIREVAPFSPASAVTALKHMKSALEEIPEQPGNGGNQGRERWAATFARATRRVIAVLGEGDAARARALADEVDDDWNGVAVRANAATLGSPAERVAQARVALESDGRGTYMRASTAARLGAMLSAIDAAQARALFDEAHQSQRKSQETWGQTQSSPEWAFYLAALDPATARLTLESQWSALLATPKVKQDEPFIGGWQRASTAIAAAPVDLARALEMARSLDVKRPQWNASPRARALSEIGRLLLMPLESHWRFSLSAQSGFDGE
ncbi:MAG TPA: carboxypeptidase-like regulatory domain-containing protein [Abditibacteriaceae bacterium]